jgi:hypothetical protein
VLPALQHGMLVRACRAHTDKESAAASTTAAGARSIFIGRRSIHEAAGRSPSEFDRIGNRKALFEVGEETPLNAEKSATRGLHRELTACDFYSGGKRDARSR